MAKNEIHAADPGDVRQFLNETSPFKELAGSVLEEVAGKFTIDFFEKGTMVLEQGVTEVENLHLISRGAVRLTHKNADDEVSLKDVRGEGGFFGALGIIKGAKATFSVETVEDTFCYLLEREVFLRLVQSYPRFAQYYLERFTDDVVDTAYAEMRSQKVSARPQSGLYLFNSRVGDVVKRQMELIPESETVQEAAWKMTELHIGSLLVHDQAGKPVGIVTDKDLRGKVVAKGLDYSTPVEKIAAYPIKTIPDDCLCFDALLQMMNQEVHHLAVSKDDEIVGVITSHDIMVQQGISPISLLREIVATRKIEGLYALSEKVPLIVRSMIDEGAKANQITRLIAVLNDHIVTRVLTLLQEETGPAPQRWCWLLLGSEGRQEQTFKTDQDNALIYETPTDDWEHIKAAKLYFRRFGNKAIEHLAACGYPLCPGEMMASNPKWRKSYAVWKGYFDRWMSAPEPQAVLHATIFFDFRPGYGQVDVGEKLRDHVAKEAPSKGIFLMHLAKDCLQGKPPLSFFRDFIVEKNGQHKNRVDLKTRGLVPFVDFGRIMALKYGVKETNTIARLDALADGDYIPRELYTETREAYEFQMQLRLVHQWRRLQAGMEPDNYVDPVDLTDSEKQTLKEAFEVISRIQSHLKDEIRIPE
jgi:CBS domain-containing protein